MSDTHTTNCHYCGLEIDWISNGHKPCCDDCEYVKVPRAWLESLYELSQKADIDMNKTKLVGFASSAKTLLNK